MLLPLRPICKEKDVRRDGTSIVFIQYCESSEKRTNLNSGIAIPPKYWDEKKATFKKNLPPEVGLVDDLCKHLKQEFRYAEDLVELAIKKNVKIRAIL